MKLALGTVQFGLDYGINNKNGSPNDDIIASIFNYAKEEGISILDTAPKYGTAEIKIGSLAESKFNVVTKFSAAKTGKDLVIQLNNSLKALRLNSVYGYLAHNADELIENMGLWEILQLEKQKGKINKIGYSLYTTQQLETLMSLNILPDLVQLPYSLLDRKFEQYFDQLKKYNIEIHIRSAFLQGLYFMDVSSLPVNLSPLSSDLESLKQICSENAISMSSLALNFAIKNAAIDNVVIGVESITQLKENIKYINAADTFTEQVLGDILNIQVKNKELLNPANW